MAYDIRVSNKATYFSAFQWRHVYNIETNTNIHITHVLGYFGGDRCPILPDGESGSWFASPAERYSWDHLAVSTWILSNKSTIQFVFFSTLLPRCLYPPTLVQVVFIDLPTPPVSPCGPSHPMPQMSTSLVSFGWFWKCLTFPGLGNRFLLRIPFCWGLWGPIHLQELVYEIRLSSEQKP